MSVELRDAVRPSTWLAVLALASLGLTVGGMLVGRLREPPPEVTLREIPDRFTKLLLEPPEPERIATLPAIGPPAPVDGPATKERGSLLTGLIGTRGENNNGDMVEDLFAAGDVPFGDLDKALQGAGGMAIAGKAAARNPDAGEGARARREDGKVGRSARKPPPPLRQWFPETFLWAPEVVTDADGHAAVEVTVPDRLGTWRVLGLSAAADGSTSGATLHFDSRLDRFVEPVVPERLYQGDRVTLPVRIGNRGSDRAEAHVRIVGAGAVSGAAEAVRSLAPGSATVAPVQLRAERPGQARVGASLEGDDRVVRSFPVEPRGDRGQQAHDGLLTGVSTIPLALPDDVSFARATLTLQPGPAGLLRQELAAGARSGAVADLAAAVALGASGAELLDAMGAPATPAEREALRSLRLSSQQRLLRADLGSDPVALSLSLLALSQVQGDPLVDEVLPLLRTRLRRLQAADGSWAVPDGAPLQQLLATTALCALALDEAPARVRAGAVFERHAPNALGRQRDDPFTAGLALAAGIPQGRTRARLRDDLLQGLSAAVADPTGLAGLRRPDGSALTLADAALAATLADAGSDRSAAVFDAWTPTRGFGDGLRTLLVLRTLERLAPPDARPDSPDTVGYAEPGRPRVVSLRAGDGPGVELRQDPSGAADSVTLDLPLDGGLPALVVEAEDPAPVRWHLVVEHWRPWQVRPHSAGLAVQLDAPDLAVGRKSALTLTVDGPGSEVVQVSLELPAGVRLLPDEVEGAVVEHSDDHSLRLRLPTSRTARREVRLPVVPTLAGELWRGAVQAWLPGETQQPAISPPDAWVISAG
ncbi:MAG: hypothetical protein H6742_11825 [Alphaproteobacteria bacterium]|nr:hypothetical protein [Alphaproteobacteria bacterium]